MQNWTVSHCFPGPFGYTVGAGQAPEAPRACALPGAPFCIALRTRKQSVVVTVKCIHLVLNWKLGQGTIALQTKFNLLRVFCFLADSRKNASKSQITNQIAQGTTKGLHRRILASPWEMLWICGTVDASKTRTDETHSASHQ